MSVIPVMRRPICKRLLVACTSAMLTLVLLEAAWRFVYTNSFGPTTNPHYVVHDDQLARGIVLALEILDGPAGEAPPVGGRHDAADVRRAA